MKKITLGILFCSIIILTGCSGLLKSTTQEIEKTQANTNGSETFTLEAWADNWFAAYLGEELIVEDSVSINTERSFNAEITSFKADYPLHLNVIMKDFKENDTGLEYIGARNQQMGDGGFIMQIKDDNGKVIAVTNKDWKCKVIHEAPLDKSCESSNDPVAGVAPCDFTNLAEPANWKSTNFDDTSWDNAVVHSESAVSPKMGYDQISWDDSAKLIWGNDLETHNTILCRTTIEKS